MWVAIGRGRRGVDTLREEATEAALYVHPYEAAKPYAEVSVNEGGRTKGVRLKPHLPLTEHVVG